MTDIAKPATPPAGEEKPGDQKPPAAGDTKPKDGEAVKAGDAKPGDKPGDQAPPAPPAAPEKYELKVPDGPVIDESDVALVERVARENGMSNEEAQELLVARDTEFKLQNEADLATLKAHKVYGGDKLAETQQLAQSFLDKLAKVYGPEMDAGLRRLLHRSGGTNLFVMAALAEAGRMSKEDGPPAGNAGANDDRKNIPLADRMYPNTPKKYSDAAAAR